MKKSQKCIKSAATCARDMQICCSWKLVSGSVRVLESFGEFWKFENAIFKVLESLKGEVLQNGCEVLDFCLGKC